MVWTIVFAIAAAVLVVAIGLAVVGRETSRLSEQARPAVFDLEEAVAFISDELPDEVAGRLTHDDVRWILQVDAASLEEASEDPEALDLGPEVLDEDAALGRVLGDADESGRELRDTDIAAVLAARSDYLRAIGAIGPQVDEPPEPDAD